jgi:hypothetical protein
MTTVTKVMSLRRLQCSSETDSIQTVFTRLIGRKGSIEILKCAILSPYTVGNLLSEIAKLGFRSASFCSCKSTYSSMSQLSWCARLHTQGRIHKRGRERDASPHFFDRGAKAFVAPLFDHKMNKLPVVMNEIAQFFAKFG